MLCVFSGMTGIAPVFIRSTIYVISAAARNARGGVKNDVGN
jgi:hypothetical protein